MTTTKKTIALAELVEKGADAGAFLARPIEPYLWIDATYLKVRQAGRDRLGCRNNRRWRQHRWRA